MSCVAHGCRSHSSKKTVEPYSVTFHRFPTNENLRALWVQAIKRENWEPSKHSRLCSKHFTPDSYVENSKRKKLLSHAVPTVFESYTKIPKGRPRGIKREKRYVFIDVEVEPTTPDEMPFDCEPETSDTAETVMELRKIISKQKERFRQRLIKFRTLQQKCRKMKKEISSLKNEIAELKSSQSPDNT